MLKLHKDLEMLKIEQTLFKGDVEQEMATNEVNLERALFDVSQQFIGWALEDMCSTCEEAIVYVHEIVKGIYPKFRRYKTFENFVVDNEEMDGIW